MRIQKCVVSCSDDNRNLEALLKKKCKFLRDILGSVMHKLCYMYFCILQNKVKHYQLRHYHDVTYIDNQCKKIS